MLKFSKLINSSSPQKGLMREAYIRHHFQKSFDNLICGLLNHTNLDESGIKYFLSEKEKDFLVRIKTTHSIHTVILKTEQFNIQESAQKILQELNISKTITIQVH